MYYSYVIQEKATGEIDRVYGVSYAEAMALNHLSPDEYYLISVHEEPDEPYDYQDDEEYQEFDDCDSDLGFDPYLGCYSDDC